MLHYLGGLSGAGDLICGDRTIARADYDFDGFLTNPGQVTSSGEIRMSAGIMKDVFGRKGLLLKTDDGRLLRLHFSEKRLASSSEAAHVDVVGELPAESEWHH
ncbi:hypothetical protein [Rhodoplanes sp.]|uniref:hypothetical protein n=1 Tax=Rhodoplanes sp. TaxID=1968906 RepID=UPI0025F6BDCA|nr:hypothetical protein [Rhodoplanes sp.]